MQQVWSFSLGLTFPRLLQIIGELLTVKAGQVSVEFSISKLLMAPLSKDMTHPAEVENNDD